MEQILFKITVWFDRKSTSYESYVLPQLGDIYPTSLFKDNKQYVVSERILPTGEDMQDRIIITVKDRFPELAQKEITETELNLISQETLS